MAKQKMIQGESTQMISADEAPAVSMKKSNKHKALVNMSLIGGTLLTEGEMVELSDEQLETLKTNFGDGLKHILES